jgi:hypothetical protein
MVFCPVLLGASLQTSLLNIKKDGCCVTVMCTSLLSQLLLTCAAALQALSVDLGSDDPPAPQQQQQQQRMGMPDNYDDQFLPAGKAQQRQQQQQQQQQASGNEAAHLFDNAMSIITAWSQQQESRDPKALQKGNMHCSVPARKQLLLLILALLELPWLQQTCCTPTLCMQMMLVDSLQTVCMWLHSSCLECRRACCSSFVSCCSLATAGDCWMKCRMGSKLDAVGGSGDRMVM